MRRGIELGAGIIAAVLEIMVAANLVVILDSSYIAGIAGLPGTPPDVGGAQHELGVATLLFVGVALGSYLHVIQKQAVGLILLAGSTIALIGGTIYILVAPGALLHMWGFIYVLVPNWLPAVMALALILSTVSAGAAVVPAPPRERTAAAPAQQPAPHPNA